MKPPYEIAYETVLPGPFENGSRKKTSYGRSFILTFTHIQRKERLRKKRLKRNLTRYISYHGINITMLHEIIDSMEKELKKAVESTENERQRLAPAVKQRGVSDADFKKHLTQFLFKQFEKSEALIYAKRGVTSAQVQEAFQKNSTDEKVARFENMLNRVKQEYSPGKQAAIPTDMTPQKFIMINERMAEIQLKAAEKFVQDWRSKNNASKAEFTKAFASPALQQEFAMVSQQATLQAMKAENIDQGIIQQAAMKYQSDPEFVAAMRESTGAMLAKFAELGIPMGPGM